MLGSASGSFFWRMIEEVKARTVVDRRLEPAADCSDEHIDRPVLKRRAIVKIRVGKWLKRVSQPLQGSIERQWLVVRGQKLGCSFRLI